MREARGSLAPLALVALAVAFGLWTLRAEVADVAYPNDAAIHDSMVRWAAARIRDGHLPFDGWYPALALGASRFHHYQSLPHIVTGGFSLMFGTGLFRWSLYLLLAGWPIAVYAGARLFELDRWSAAIAAATRPSYRAPPGSGSSGGATCGAGPAFGPSSGGCGLSPSRGRSAGAPSLAGDRWRSPRGRSGSRSACTC